MRDNAIGTVSKHRGCLKQAWSGVRTLQRQLKQQDVLLSDITEGILKQGALQPLQATNAPILQIALTL